MTEGQEYDAFFEAMLVPPNVKADHEWRRKLARRFREETLLAIVNLHDIGVAMTGDPHPAPPTDCDLCGEALRTRVFVDGETTNGSWANMCFACYLREGVGIGWGIGQVYISGQPDAAEPVWRLLGGGDNAEDE